MPFYELKGQKGDEKKVSTIKVIIRHNSTVHLLVDDEKKIYNIIVE